MSASSYVPDRRSPTRLALALLASAALAAAWLGPASAATTFPAALANALVNDADVATCAEQAHAASNAAYASANFQLENVTLRSGEHMAVVTGGGSCVCGNANCKVAVFARQGNAYREVLSDYAIEWHVRPDGSATTLSHDSAAVALRTTYKWSGKRYAATTRETVYLPSNVAKPYSRTITFAPGASSAIVEGSKVTAGFEDRFSLKAAPGQRLTLTLLRHDRHFGSFSVESSGGQFARAKTGTLSVTLPASGPYSIIVDGGDESFTHYALSVKIH